MRRLPGETRQKVFDFVRQRVLAGTPPTVREVQEALGFRAVQSAQEHLEALVVTGRLTKAPGQSRAYRLPESERAGTPAAFIPLLGRVQAGLLTEAVEDREGYVPVEVDHGRLSHRQADRLFALRVRGDSMTGAGILDGDLVIVHRQATAESGEIVVALIGEETTVKRLRRRRGRIELCPENPAFAPIIVTPPDEVTLLGKVIEVRRYLDGFHHH
ncbi:MAG: transcriptional repressor LexA [Candidatus Sericytochromatia bacterium]|nr:transcriptional repressor LexA [Candidatus Sericytochromatia bacterium]